MMASAGSLPHSKHSAPGLFGDSLLRVKPPCEARCYRMAGWVPLAGKPMQIAGLLVHTEQQRVCALYTEQQRGCALSVPFPQTVCLRRLPSSCMWLGDPSHRKEILGWWLPVLPSQTPPPPLLWPSTAQSVLLSATQIIIRQTFWVLPLPQAC